MLRYCLFAVVFWIGLGDLSYAQLRPGSGSGGGVTGWPSSNSGRITFADGEVNAAGIGSSTDYMKFFCDPTLGCMIKPSSLGDSYWRIWENFNGCIRDMEASGGVGANMLCFDPDAATPLLMYPFQAGYYPLKSTYLSAGYWDGDGTNCPSTPTVVTINSGPKMPTFVCADSSSSILHATLILPPDYVAGTTLKVIQYIIQTAADTGSLNGDISAQCRGNGETISSTWGTAVPLDLANVTGSNAQNMITATGITPAGTCNPGDLLSLRYVFDSASTTASSTLHFVGFEPFWSSGSLSH